MFLPLKGVHYVCFFLFKGAGDAFVGTLAYFYATRKDLEFEEIVKRASSVAAVTVTRQGTQTSYPDRSELPKGLFV